MSPRTPAPEATASASADAIENTTTPTRKRTGPPTLRVRRSPFSGASPKSSSVVLRRALSGTRLEEDADQHREYGHGDDQGGYQGEGHGQGERDEELETMPPTRASGRKTAVVVSVDEVMALATSVVPLRAASSGS